MVRKRKKKSVQKILKTKTSLLSLFRSHYANKVVFEKLLPLFCSLKDTIDDPTRKVRDFFFFLSLLFFFSNLFHWARTQALMKQVCDILGELEPTLPATSVPEGAGEQAVLGAKQCLLELWHHLMESAERLAPGEIGPVVFNAVLGVMRRPEFDVSHLHLDVHMRPTCEVHDVMLAFRYRRLLFATMAYIARVLTVASDPSALAASTPEIPAKSPPGAGGGEKKTGPQLSPPPDRWAREVIRAATVKTIPEDAADLEVLDVVEVKTGVDGNPETPATATTTTTKRNPEGPPPLEVPEQRPVIIDEVAKIKAKTGEDETPSASATAPAAAAKMKAVTADEVDEPPAVAEAAAASLLFTPMKRYAPRGSNLSSNFVTFASKALAILFFRLPRKWFTFLLHPLSLSLSRFFYQESWNEAERQAIAFSLHSAGTSTKS